MKSENWGGLTSLVASGVVLSGGGSNVVAAGFYTAAELLLLGCGQTVAGYSAGVGLLAVGNAVMASASADTATNMGLKFQFTAAAVTFGIGAARYPLQVASHKLAARHPVTATRLSIAAAQVQPWVGAVATMLIVPGLVAAVGGNNPRLATAYALWGAADILCGRVQDLIAPMLQCRRQAKPRPREQDHSPK
jgi:hypothetical protein